MPNYPREVPKWDVYRCCVCDAAVPNLSYGRGRYWGGGVYIVACYHHFHYMYDSRKGLLSEALEWARAKYLEDCYYNWII